MSESHYTIDWDKVNESGDPILIVKESALTHSKPYIILPLLDLDTGKKFTGYFTLSDLEERR